MTLQVVGIIDDIIGDPNDAWDALINLIEPLKRVFCVKVEMLNGNTGVKVILTFTDEKDRDAFMKGGSEPERLPLAMLIRIALKFYFRRVTFTEV